MTQDMHNLPSKDIFPIGCHNLGSLEGRLDAIEVHGQQPVAVIWERMSGAPVHCPFRREEMERVNGLQGKLVRITGDIHYTADGIPRRISNVVAFDDATTLPCSERAGFGSIPDKRVQELGASEWLKIVRGMDLER